MSVREFYKDKHVFITGGTGFMGMVLLEKLLRSFPDIRKLYVVIRSKSGESPKERIQKYFDNEIFSTLKKSNKNYTSKVAWVEGDLLLPNLGIEANNLHEIRNNVNIIIHNAASVNFNEPLKSAIDINIRATYYMLKIACECPHLKSFIHVSTTCINFRDNENYIEERLYRHPFEPMDLLQMSEKEILLKSHEMLKGWVNSYAFTKNAAENLVYKYRNNFSIGIYRPAAVSYTYADPIPSWGLHKTGLPRVIQHLRKGYDWHVGNTVNSNTVPVDMTINGLIVAVRDTAVNRQSKFYNYASVKENVLLFKDIRDYFLKSRKHLLQYDCKKYENYCERKDAIMISKGLKPWYSKQHISTKKYNEYTKMFCITNYDCQAGNIRKLWREMFAEDRNLLFFDLNKVNWIQYLERLYQAMPPIYDDDQFPQDLISKL